LYYSWDECEAQVKGYTGAKHRKFRDVGEAQAWLTDSTTTTSTPATNFTSYSALVQSAIAVEKSSNSNGPAPPGFAKDAVIVYTDGASKNNQDAGARIAGYGIHWSTGRPAAADGDIAARCPGAPGEGKTNNFGELLAIIRTLELMQDDPRSLHIRSDSKYSIDCFDWIHGWERKGWVKSDGKPIANLPMIRYMDALRKLRVARGFPFEIAHVKGHATDTGNIRADALANAGTLKTCNEPEPDWTERRARVEREIERARTKATVVNVQQGAPVRMVVSKEEVDLSLFEASDLLDDDELLAELNE